MEDLILVEDPTQPPLVGQAIAERVDAAALLTSLRCAAPLLSDLPNGTRCLVTTEDIGVAIDAYPDVPARPHTWRAATPCTFRAAHCASRAPCVAQVCPTPSLAALAAQVSVTSTLFSDLALPVDTYPIQVPPLLSDLQHLSATLATLPDLPLLGDRLLQVWNTQTHHTSTPATPATPATPLLGDRLLQVWKHPRAHAISTRPPP